MAHKSNKIVILGATGAVGGEVLKSLLSMDIVSKITLLGRRDVEGITQKYVQQRKANIFDPSGYAEYVADHDTAICTLGVGQPSKVSDEEFIKIDKTAVIEFAKICKLAGIKHFELLSSVGINHKSSNLYLRIKGELVEELQSLNFERLSIFQPSMIITPNNRYGFSQALTLKLWPIIDKLFFGPLRKYKGIKVEQLGNAIAKNIFTTATGIEMLTWSNFQSITNR